MDGGVLHIGVTGDQLVLIAQHTRTGAVRFAVFVDHGFVETLLDNGLAIGTGGGAAAQIDVTDGEGVLYGVGCKGQVSQGTHDRADHQQHSAKNEEDCFACLLHVFSSFRICLYILFFLYI